MWGKWNRTHQCAAVVQLNVLQEVWDLFDNIDKQEHEDLGEEQLFLAISEAAVSSQEAPKTLKLRGSIQNIQILLLLDSGSIHSFVSEQVATLL
jgi:hypothetical protein